MLIILLMLLDRRSWLTDLFLLKQIFQYTVGLVFMLSFLAVKLIVQCVGENVDIVIGNISLLPIPEVLKEQLCEQMHCIARYYREKTKR